MFASGHLDLNIAPKLDSLNSNSAYDSEVKTAQSQTITKVCMMFDFYSNTDNSELINFKVKTNGNVINLNSNDDSENCFELINGLLRVQLESKFSPFDEKHVTVDYKIK